MAEKRDAERRSAHGPLDSARRVARRLTQPLRANGRKAVALLLVLALCYESLFTSGVTLALAEALAGEETPEVTMVDSPETGATGQENAAGGGSSEQDTSESDSPDESPGVVEDGQEGQGEDQGTGQQPEQTQQESGEQDGAGDQAGAQEPAAIEPWDWTGRTQNLALGSDGLTIDAAEASDGSLSALSGSLSLTFSLDPAAEGSDTGDHNAVVPGDSFVVDLPEGLTVSDEGLLAGEKADVFQADDEGNATTTRIAELSAEKDGAAVRVTFVEPTDEGVTVGMPATPRAALDLAVSVDPSLVGEGETELEWVLQTADDGTTQTATLVVPSRSTCEALAEPSADLPEGAQVAEQEIAAMDSALNVLSALALPDTRTVDPGTWSYVFRDLSASASMTITWCDNNSASRPAMTGENSYPSKVIPQFSLDGGTKWIDLVDENGSLTSEARTALHIGESAAPAWAKPVSASATGVGTWDLSASGLPTELRTVVTVPKLDEGGSQVYDEHGNPETVVVKLDDNGKPLYEENDNGVSQPVVADNGVSKTQTIAWRLSDTNDLPSSYTYGESDEGATGAQRYLMLTQNFTFTITGKLGDKTLEDVFGIQLDNEDYASHFLFSALIDNKQVVDKDGNPRSSTLANMLKASYGEGQSFGIAFSEDGKTATITAALPMYDTNGAPIVYYAYFEDPDAAAGDDYFQPAYNNSGSASHGSAVDKLYAGGTMTIRPMGLTSYDATKAWLDGGNQDNRPEVTFSLWRYSTNGTAQTASQVQLNATNDGGDVSTESIEYVTIKVPADSAGTVDLGELLAQQYGEQGKSSLDDLPKYDPDGYPYIYALREDTSTPGYETVYGSVASDGVVTDKNPNYVDEDGVTQTLGAPDRASDHFIYSGGTITNRLTGTVEVEATKTWEIAAFQDSLKDVEVTFTVQSRLKNPNLFEGDASRNLV